MTFNQNLIDVFGPTTAGRDADGGTLVETVILVASFAVITLLFVNWVGTAILNKAAESADCIEGASVYSASDSAKRCKESKAKHSDKHSFTKDSEYKSRFGG